MATPAVAAAVFARTLAAQTNAVEIVAPNVLSMAHWARLGDGELYASQTRVDWARLLRRTFDFDVKQCAQCGGRRVVRAVVTAPESIAKDPQEPRTDPRATSRRVNAGTPLSTLDALLLRLLGPVRRTPTEIAPNLANFPAATTTSVQLARRPVCFAAETPYEWLSCVKQASIRRTRCSPYKVET